MELANRISRVRVMNNVKQQEESKVQKQAAKYARSLIEANLSPMIIISPEAKIMDINEATVKMIGISREELIGSDFFYYFTKSQKARAVYLKVCRCGYVIDYPFTVFNKDGKFIDVLFNGSVYKDDSGKVLGVVVVIRDITNQKKFENELIEARYNAEQASKKAEESTKLKEAFLANMSHEIRTPMNAILGFADMLSKRKLADQEMEYVSTIKTAGENLLGIINDILDISKIEAGMMTFESNNFCIREAFKLLNGLLIQKAKEKNLELIFNCDDDVPEVLRGDYLRFTQIIINLAGNAIKFTKNGSVVVHAKVLKDESDTILMEFSVTDSGIGIQPEKLDQIFERFRQAESHTTRKYGGTGLGLSIAKQLVELQGGSMYVQSKLNVGSKFSFSIPYKKSSQINEIPKVVESKYRIEDLSKLKILLVEDNQLNVKLILYLFNENNLKLWVAENGQVCIEKLKETNFDIILMDMEMPVMNGYEATTIIRKELKNDLPIIAMTANAMAGEKERCLNFGMNDYISKPINANVLFEKIYKLTVDCNEYKTSQIVV